MSIKGRAAYAVVDVAPGMAEGAEENPEWERRIVATLKAVVWGAVGPPDAPRVRGFFFSVPAKEKQFGMKGFDPSLTYRRIMYTVIRDMRCER